MNSFLTSDVSSFTLSIVVSNLVYDILSSLIPFLNKSNFIG